MRSSLSLAALSAVLLQGTTAMRGINHQNLRIMAEMGFNADGTLLDPSSSSEPLAFNDFEAVTAAVSNAAAETITAEYVELPIDHFGSYNGSSSPGTYKNRFYVREGAYKPGGPVFLYDYGEATASLTYAQSRLQANTSFFKEMVDKYNGIGIVWEHRYYGDSLPTGPVTRNVTAENLRWLTTEQSLADVDAFAKQFHRPNINYTLTPDQTPWIFVGGSYPGMRASFMREKYPDTIFASYASSAPTEAKVDMSVYFEPVVRGMKAQGWGNCTADIHAAILQMDRLMDNPKTSAALKRKFFGHDAAKNDNGAFADALTGIFNYWQSYGVEGGIDGLRSFCDYLETDPTTNAVAPAAGWAASRGANYVVSRWASNVEFQNFATSYMGTTGSNCTAAAPKNSTCTLDILTSDPDYIAWRWQYCTQWGYFQTANFGPNQVVSKYNSLAHQQDICLKQYPDAPRSLLPVWPAVAETNKVFGGWSLRPSNVYWSGGEFDPWRTLSPLSSEPFAPHPTLFTDTPQCGQGSSLDRIFAYVIPGGNHCYDFRLTGGVPGGATSRGYFYAAVTQWLKCFQPKKGASRFAVRGGRWER